MKPLSAAKYFWENKKKTLLILAVFLLTIIAISFTASLVNSAFVSAETVTLEPFHTASVAAATDGEYFLDDETVGKIESMAEVKKAVPLNSFEATLVDSMMGNCMAHVIFIDSPALPEIITDYYNLKLKDGGRMPNLGEHELVMHEDVMLNKGLKVGDEFGDAVNDKEWMAGRYTIVGSLSGKTVMCFGARSNTGAALEKVGVDLSKHTVALLLFPKNGIAAMNAGLQALSKSEARVVTYDNLRKDLDDQLASVQSLIGIIMFVMIFAMGVSIGALIMIAYADRSGEFGILFAIGYSKKQVGGLICKEIGVLSVIGTAIGYALSILILFLVDLIIFKPAGKPMAFFSTYGVIFTLIVPVMVFACAVLPILARFRKTDLVATIEGH